MTPKENSQPLKRVASMCRDIPFSKMLSSVVCGAQASIYRPATIVDMELTSPQCLLLALLYSLVTGVRSCLFLSCICVQVEKLWSRHLRVWLMEDFSFPRPEVENVMALLVELVTDGTLNLPPHVTTMTSLAKKYGITEVQLRTRGISLDDYHSILLF